MGRSCVPVDHLREMPGPADPARTIADIRAQFLLDGPNEARLDPSEIELLGRLAQLIGSRGLETPGHLERIGEYSRLLARAAGLGTEEAERIRLAAPLHDVGKVAIADAILLKEGELDIAEREEMQRHAEAGHELLGGCTSDILQLAGEIALTHHERFDGRGYPQGLSDDMIPLPGRIVAVADVFDALICDRPHRRAMSLEDAVKVMLRGRGAHFDPRLLDHFLLDLDAMLAAASRTTDLDLVQTL
jgi:putative two-component system response regulator